MSEPMIIYRAEDGEPLEVYGLAQRSVLLAKGEYVLELPEKGKAGPAVKEATVTEEPAPPAKATKSAKGKM